MDTLLRHAVRALLLDEHDRVLLFRTVHPDTGAVFWFTPGGGIEPGEDVRGAAARELEEETGQRDVDLAAEIWHRRHLLTWRGVRHDQRERWFLARVAHFAPDMSNVTDQERIDLTAWRWWSVEELAATRDGLAPRDLGSLLEALPRDGPPPAPLQIGV
jgi:8-oxo-dGTP pyrophosphatase MutT (NUDIX family)